MSSEPAAAGTAAGQARRVAAIALAVLVLLLVPIRYGSAETVQLPPDVQAGLIAKVAGFDRNFAARARGKALVLLVAMPNDPESTRAALELKGSLGRLSEVGGLPHQEEIVSYSSASALADQVHARKAAIVYFGPGLGRQIPAIREGFTSLDVLTVASVADYVPAGIVLGFDLVSGRPKLLVNLTQAKKQQVAFPASVLNLMKVFS
jgi:hypothetical protein